MAFKNFAIWRGRLPHWRADDVRYYVTFRFRRELGEDELQALMKRLMRTEGRSFDLLALCLLPESAEMLFTVLPGPTGRPYELSDVIEKAKNQAAKEIMKKSGERLSPFYGESFDRIVRDDDEFEERWLAMLEAPVKAELAEDPEDYAFLWLRAD